MSIILLLKDTIFSIGKDKYETILIIAKLWLIVSAVPLL